MNNDCPLKLYHGTYSEFEQFRPLSHFGTLKAAQKIVSEQKACMKYEGFMTVKYNSLSDLMNDRGDIGKSKIIPVYLNVNQPMILPDFAAHNLNGYKQIVFTLLMSEQLGGQSALHYSSAQSQKTNRALNDVFGNVCRSARFMSEFDFIFKHPFECSADKVKEELELGKLYPVLSSGSEGFSADEKNRHHLSAQRMIRFFESRGYDGICYVNQFENKNSKSFVIFRPDQVMRLDRKQYSFKKREINATDELRLNQIRAETVKTIEPKPLSDWEIIKQKIFELEVAGINNLFSKSLIPAPKQVSVHQKCSMEKTDFQHE